MHSLKRSLLLSLLVPTLSFAAAPSTQSTVKVTTDRPDAMCHVGDKVTFRVAGTLSPDLSYKITKDGFGQPISTGPVDTLPADIQSSLSEPGFLRLEILSGTKSIAVYTAGVDPDQIKPSLPVPEDFDSFWATQKDLIKAEEPHPTLTPIASPDKTIDTYDLQVNCPGGAPLSAYYAKPKGAKPKSLPAILFPHSAGVRSSQLNVAVHGAQMGCLSLDFNAHGIPNGRPAEYYTDLLNNGLKGYSARGRDLREDSYFRGMYLRLLRAIEFATTQPEWDGKTLIVYGSSQGGGQAIVAAGLDPRVTLCCASVPALCDHTGFAAGRISGWPKLVPYSASGRWKYDDQVTQASRYFDAMNFAPRVRARTIVTVGLIDNVVPPTSVYAAFNAIPADKTILPQPGMWHEFPPRLQHTFDDAVKAHIAAQRKE